LRAPAVRGLLIVLALGWALAAAAEVAVPPLTGRVVDRTGTLSSQDIAALTEKLRAYEERKGSQIAVLLVPTTQPETIEQYSIRVAEAWKIGRKKIDDGAILVIAKNDRRLRIEVGYGLEGSLTDATSRRIIAEDVTPKFRTGDFAAGVNAGVDRIIRVIEGEQLPAPEPPHWQSPGLTDQLENSLPFLLLAVLMIGGFLRAMLGRLFGSAATGGLVGLFAWMTIGSAGVAVFLGLAAFFVAFVIGAFSMPGGGGYGYPGGRSRRGGWSGGGWSGGSGSGGGFSGGGGGFGGGGASGNW
jgi:uncharacterized protein